MTWLIDGPAFPDLTLRTPVRAPAPGTQQALDLLPGVPELTEVRARCGEDGLEDTARAWTSTAPLHDPEGTWRRCAQAFDRTGLWPLLAGRLDEHPYADGEPMPPTVPDDAAAVLGQAWWGCQLVRPDGTRLPHPPWPGLAPGRGAPDDSGVLLSAEHPLPLFGGLLLVPAVRPADAVAQLGWSGACNWSLTGAAIAGVLRSWEDRFGAYLVGIGWATLELVVTRPPVTARQCDLLAHEHFAFCPDNFHPQTGPDDRPISHDEYAAGLRAAPRWHFWWD
ncbi:DUF4253 domain-containing protein [Modestobacter sp. NPDC049651]|uniref:DUF4253 domain-containing protein n=1 Tax=unclassified Modestobacter TaxID=2643866 RepID=UPI0033D9742F